jgi:hypothetical protein
VKFRGKLGESPALLLDGMEADKRVSQLVEKLYHYASLRAAEDSSDAANLARESQLQNLLTKIGEACAFMAPEIQAIDDAAFARFLQDPSLAEWSVRHPGAMLLELAKEHGVTAVVAVREQPAALATRLEGWISDEIMKARLEGKTLPEYTDQIAGLVRMALTRFAVESELVVDGDVRTHAITGLDLGPAGLQVRASIQAAEGETLMQQPEIVVDAAGALSLGDQRFGLAYGAHAWQGIDAASAHLFGGAVREALGASIDCARVASAVAAQCLLGVCVGKEPELREVCEGGLDALVEVTRERLAAVQIDELHFSQGTAIVVDEDGDGEGDRITDGVWQAELNLGGAPLGAKATFAGER